MILDIKPLHFEGAYCHEDFVFSIAAHYNRKYELAFCESWDFKFWPEDPEFPGLLGNRISKGNSNMLKLLEKYCGIKTEIYHPTDFEDLITTIQNELSNLLPIGIFIDKYWCPWTNEYQKLHHPHYCLAVGIDSDKNLYCIDPSMNKDTSILPISDFSKGFKECFKFRIDEIMCNHDYLALIRESIEKIIKSQYIEMLEDFINEFKSSFNFNMEYRNYTISYWDVYIDRNIRLISGSRMNFARFVEFIAAKTQITALTDCIDDINVIASKWNTIRCILVKSYHVSYTEKMNDKVIDRFNEIVRLERAFIEKISDIINNSNTSNNSNEQRVLIENELSEVIFIDLKSYFNNNAFYSPSYNNRNSDFTGNGLCFLNDKINSGVVWDVSGMTFNFPEIVEEQYNNVYCEKQEIDIPCGVYSKVMLLGSSDWGAMSDFQTASSIKYIDNIILKSDVDDEINLRIEFPSWCFEKALNAESVAWTGNGCKKSEDGIELLDNNFKIYAISYLIKKDIPINKIVLPDCPSIHIFAISLQK
jgi:hypothetical protein